MTLCVFVCFFMFFSLSITVQFSDCENNVTQLNTICDENIKPGSDETRLALYERILNMLMWPISIAKSFMRSAITWISGNKEDSQDKEEGYSFAKNRRKFQKYARLTHPGTLWCGSGNIARNESNLGLFMLTDACCREHDNCKSDILAGEIMMNLKNNGYYTRSACSCDHQFYKCLKNASSSIINPIAFEIGNVYFNILGPQCFKCLCPMKNCSLDDGTECKDRCRKYEWCESPIY